MQQTDRDGVNAMSPVLSADPLLGPEELVQVAAPPCERTDRECAH